jgi:ADP-heptose:LPS heptosyltransferase
LSWIVGEAAGSLLQGHEALDELITVPRRWLKSPKGLWWIRGRLRRMRLDVAIDAQGLTKSALAAWLSGAKRRIGFGSCLGREQSKWLNTEFVLPTSQHVIDCHLELLRPLGIQSAAVRFGIPEAECDAQAAEKMICEAGFDDGAFAIVNPGAGWPSRLWPPTRYAELVGYLGRVHGCPSFVVWAGEEERAWAKQIVAGSDRHACLAPSTTLRELAALTRRSRLFISSDTGPMHLAVAVGTSCVSLHGPTLAEHSGPYGKEHIVVQKAALGDRFDPRRKTISNVLMKAISAKVVCEACDRLLSRSQAGRAA